MIITFNLFENRGVSSVMQVIYRNIKVLKKAEANKKNHRDRNIHTEYGKFVYVFQCLSVCLFINSK